MHYPILILIAALSLAAQPTQPGTKWTDDQLREAVALARTGRKLTPKSWPNRARVAVGLSFDDDTEAPLLRDGTTSPRRPSYLNRTDGVVWSKNTSASKSIATR